MRQTGVQKSIDWTLYLAHFDSHSLPATATWQIAEPPVVINRSPHSRTHAPTFLSFHSISSAVFYRMFFFLLNSQICFTLSTSFIPFSLILSRSHSLNLSLCLPFSPVTFRKVIEHQNLRMQHNHRMRSNYAVTDTNKK